jgi:ABC-type transport system involved in cytochrome bd biosynthesis fused ATPase/permease subunit
MSALDAKVGAFITEETILKKLKDKTIIMVTHGLQYLKYSDYIYVMDEGEMLLEGSFDDVQSSELYQKFLELDEVRIQVLAYFNCFSGQKMSTRRMMLHFQNLNW